MRNRQVNRGWLKKWPEIFFGVVAVLLIHRLFVYCLTAQSDFEVYWYAARAWLDGKPPYDRYNFAFPGLVFKYPPWLLPVFFPFTGISLQASKWIWMILQIIAMGYSIFWMTRKGVSSRVAYLVALLFWYVWFANVYFGQIMVFLLAIALWACDGASKQNSKMDLKLGVLACALSTKVFPVFALVGIWKKMFRPRPIFFTLLWVLIGHGILWATRPDFTSSQNWLGLYQEFAHASASGSTDLGTVRGPQNHGFCKAILNAFHIDETWVAYDIGLALLLAIVFGGLWYRFSRKLSLEEKWSGWLAISVITHPLAWNHSFVFAFPLCAFALQRALETRRRLLMTGVLLGISCVGLLLPQVVGVEFVEPFERLANKSWGVLLCGVLLILSVREQEKKKIYG